MNNFDVLAKKEIGEDGIWYLIKYDNHYAYGTEKEIKSLYFVPISQCGTKKEVKTQCESIIRLCRKNIKDYKKKMEKDKNKGWEIMIKYEEKELDALTTFSEVLANIK